MSLEFLLASGIGLVTASGIYLILRGRSWPVVLGLNLLGYAVNAFIFAMGRLWLDASPLIGHDTPPTARTLADPIPPALVLTAIVIGFATTGLLLELALRGYHTHHSDHVDGHEPGTPAREEDTHA
ncbi:Na+/H+ antiporter subunit C [Brachymonas sp.]|uniref:Na+/H+ antiporter subunit C n=1 Tax=Brachymonas sp. TaxID=1936292 RepID=UPI0035AFB42E